jgi:hypothetical protein
MSFKFLAPQAAGYPSINGAPLAAPAALRFLPLQPGFLASAYDPVFGQGEFIFARANGAIRQFGLCVLTPVYDATSRTYLSNMTEVPNTANLGRPVYVAQSSGAMVAGQYGWFMMSGVTPVNSTASVAADSAFGIVAAGQVGANSAGKQINGGRTVQAGAATIVKNAVSGLAGANTIVVDNVDGLFVGQYVSGTGVGAAAAVTAIDEISNEVTVSVVNSAAVSGSVTFTFNNATIFYNVVQVNRPFAQGAIT